MPSSRRVDRSVYNTMREYLIEKRLEFSPVVNIVGDVNLERVNPSRVVWVIRCIQRHASYRNYAGYPAMYVRDNVVYLNS